MGLSESPIFGKSDGPKEGVCGRIFFGAEFEDGGEIGLSFMAANLALLIANVLVWGQNLRSNIATERT